MKTYKITFTTENTENAEAQTRSIKSYALSTALVTLYSKNKVHQILDVAIVETVSNAL